MAATVTALLTKFSGATSTTSDCEAVTDWSGSPVLDTINNLENLGCLSKKVSNTALTFLYTLVSSLNLTNEHIYVWMMVTTVGKLATKANGGMRIRIEDGSANWREWNVAGGDTYAGGWKKFCHRSKWWMDFSKCHTANNYSNYKGWSSLLNGSICYGKCY